MEAHRGLSVRQSMMSEEAVGKDAGPVALLAGPYTGNTTALVQAGFRVILLEAGGDDVEAAFCRPAVPGSESSTCHLCIACFEGSSRMASRHHCQLQQLVYMGHTATNRAAVWHAQCKHLCNGQQVTVTADIVMITQQQLRLVQGLPKADGAEGMWPPSLIVLPCDSSSNRSCASMMQSQLGNPWTQQDVIGRAGSRAQAVAEGKLWERSAVQTAANTTGSQAAASPPTHPSSPRHPHSPSAAGPNPSRVHSALMARTSQASLQGTSNDSNVLHTSGGYDHIEPDGMPDGRLADGHAAAAASEHNSSGHAITAGGSSNGSAITGAGPSSSKGGGSKLLKGLHSLFQRTSAGRPPSQDGSSRRSAELPAAPFAAPSAAAAAAAAARLVLVAPAAEQAARVSISGVPRGPAVAGGVGSIHGGRLTRSLDEPPGARVAGPSGSTPWHSGTAVLGQSSSSTHRSEAVPRIAVGVPPHVALPSKSTAPSEAGSSPPTSKRILHFAMDDALEGVKQDNKSLQKKHEERQQQHAVAAAAAHFHPVSQEDQWEDMLSSKQRASSRGRSSREDTSRTTAGLMSSDGQSDAGVGVTTESGLLSADLAPLALQLRRLSGRVASTVNSTANVIAQEGCSPAAAPDHVTAPTVSPPSCPEMRSPKQEAGPVAGKRSPLRGQVSTSALPTGPAIAGAGVTTDGDAPGGKPPSPRIAAQKSVAFAPDVADAQERAEAQKQPGGSHTPGAAGAPSSAPRGVPQQHHHHHHSRHHPRRPLGAGPSSQPSSQPTSGVQDLIEALHYEPLLSALLASLAQDQQQQQSSGTRAVGAGAGGATGSAVQPRAGTAATPASPHAEAAAPPAAASPVPAGELALAAAGTAPPQLELCVVAAPPDAELDEGQEVAGARADPADAGGAPADTPGYQAKLWHLSGRVIPSGSQVVVPADGAAEDASAALPTGQQQQQSPGSNQSPALMALALLEQPQVPLHEAPREVQEAAVDMYLQLLTDLGVLPDRLVALITGGAAEQGGITTPHHVSAGPSVNGQAVSPSAGAGAGPVARSLSPAAAGALPTHSHHLLMRLSGRVHSGMLVSDGGRSGIDNSHTNGALHPPAEFSGNRQLQQLLADHGLVRAVQADLQSLPERLLNLMTAGGGHGGPPSQHRLSQPGFPGDTTHSASALHNHHYQQAQSMNGHRPGSPMFLQRMEVQEGLPSVGGTPTTLSRTPSIPAVLVTANASGYSLGASSRLPSNLPYLLHMEQSLLEGAEEGASGAEPPPASGAAQQAGGEGRGAAPVAPGGGASDAELEQHQAAAFMAAVLSDLQDLPERLAAHLTAMSLSGYHASASIRGRHDLASQVQSLASGQQLLVGAPASEQDVWAAPRPRSPTEPQGERPAPDSPQRRALPFEEARPDPETSALRQRTGSSSPAAPAAGISISPPVPAGAASAAAPAHGRGRSSSQHATVPAAAGSADMSLAHLPAAAALLNPVGSHMYPPGNTGVVHAMYGTPGMAARFRRLEGRVIPSGSQTPAMPGYGAGLPHEGCHASGATITSAANNTVSAPLSACLAILMARVQQDLAALPDRIAATHGLDWASTGGLQDGHSSSNTGAVSGALSVSASHPTQGNASSSHAGLLSEAGSMHNSEASTVHCRLLRLSGRLAPSFTVSAAGSAGGAMLLTRPLTSGSSYTTAIQATGQPAQPVLANGGSAAPSPGAGAGTSAGTAAGAAFDSILAELLEQDIADLPNRVLRRLVPHTSLQHHLMSSAASQEIPLASGFTQAGGQRSHGRHTTPAGLTVVPPPLMPIPPSVEPVGPRSAGGASRSSATMSVVADGDEPGRHSLPEASTLAAGVSGSGRAPALTRLRARLVPSGAATPTYGQRAQPHDIMAGAAHRLLGPEGSSASLRRGTRHSSTSNIIPSSTLPAGLLAAGASVASRPSPRTGAGGVLTPDGQSLLYLLLRLQQDGMQLEERLGFTAANVAGGPSINGAAAFLSNLSGPGRAASTAASDAEALQVTQAGRRSSAVVTLTPLPSLMAREQQQALFQALLQDLQALPGRLGAMVSNNGSLGGYALPPEIVPVMGGPAAPAVNTVGNRAVTHILMEDGLLSGAMTAAGNSSKWFSAASNAGAASASVLAATKNVLSPYAEAGASQLASLRHSSQPGEFGDEGLSSEWNVSNLVFQPLQSLPAPRIPPAHPPAQPPFAAWPLATATAGGAARTSSLPSDITLQQPHAPTSPGPSPRASSRRARSVVLQQQLEASLAQGTLAADGPDSQLSAHTDTGIIEQLLGSNSAPGLGSNHSYATKGNHAHGSGANGSRSHGQLPDDEGSQHAPMVVGVITLQDLQSISLEPGPHSSLMSGPPSELMTAAQSQQVLLRQDARPDLSALSNIHHHTAATNTAATNVVDSQHVLLRMDARPDLSAANNLQQHHQHRPYTNNLHQALLRMDPRLAMMSAASNAQAPLDSQHMLTRMDARPDLSALSNVQLPLDSQHTLLRMDARPDLSALSNVQGVADSQHMLLRMNARPDLSANNNIPGMGFFEHQHQHQQGGLLDMHPYLGSFSSRLPSSSPLRSLLGAASGLAPIGAPAPQPPPHGPSPPQVHRHTHSAGQTAAGGTGPAASTSATGVAPAGSNPLSPTPNPQPAPPPWGSPTGRSVRRLSMLSRDSRDTASILGGGTEPDPSATSPTRSPRYASGAAPPSNTRSGPRPSVSCSSRYESSPFNGQREGGASGRGSAGSGSGGASGPGSSAEALPAFPLHHMSLTPGAPGPLPEMSEEGSSTMFSKNNSNNTAAVAPGSGAASMDHTSATPRDASLAHLAGASHTQQHQGRMPGAPPATQVATSDAGQQASLIPGGWAQDQPGSMGGAEAALPHHSLLESSEGIQARPASQTNPSDTVEVASLSFLPGARPATVLNLAGAGGSDRASPTGFPAQPANRPLTGGRAVSAIDPSVRGAPSSGAAAAQAAGAGFAFTGSSHPTGTGSAAGQVRGFAWCSAHDTGSSNGAQHSGGNSVSSSGGILPGLTQGQGRYPMFLHNNSGEDVRAAAQMDSQAQGQQQQVYGTVVGGFGSVATLAGGSVASVAHAAAAAAAGGGGHDSSSRALLWERQQLLQNQQAAASAGDYGNSGFAGAYAPPQPRHIVALAEGVLFPCIEDGGGAGFDSEALVHASATTTVQASALGVQGALYRIAGDLTGPGSSESNASGAGFWLRRLSGRIDSAANVQPGVGSFAHPDAFGRHHHHASTGSATAAHLLQADRSRPQLVLGTEDVDTERESSSRSSDSPSPAYPEPYLAGPHSPPPTGEAVRE